MLMPAAQRRVWVDAWQMQCCGVPFAVRDDVTWTVVPELDHDYLTAVLGTEAAESVTDAEEHHADVGRLPTLVGTVARLVAVSCRLNPSGAPVPGTADIEDLDRADPWHKPRNGSGRLIAFVVDVAPSG